MSVRACVLAIQQCREGAGYNGGKGGREDGTEVDEGGIIKKNISQTRTNSEAMRGRAIGKELKEIG